MDYSQGTDYGWGAAAGAPQGGAPPPQPPQGGPPPGMEGPPMPTLPDPMTMSVKELKAELMNLGVDFTDCYEKSELVAKLQQVQEKQRHVLTIDARTLSPATAAVIFLHGPGDHAAGWLGPVQALGQGLPHVRFMIPNAPVLKVTLNGGQPMPAWFDIQALDPSAPEDVATIDISEQFLSELIRDEVAKGIRPERIVVGGFSQGGAVAVNCAIKYKERLGGAFVLSGWLPTPARIAGTASPANNATPIIFMHGADDKVVAPTWGQNSAEALKKTHPQTEFVLLQGMGHQSNLDEMGQLGAWLKKVIP